MEKIKAGSAFEVKLREKANELLTLIQTRQFMATASLLREIFTVTSPLSRYLQTVDIDFSKAVPVIGSVITSLQKMRVMPDDIFWLMADDDFRDTEWRATHVHHRRRPSVAEDEPAENPEAACICSTFYVVLDQVLRPMGDRFDKTLFAMRAVFCPNQFPELVKRFKTATDLQRLQRLKQFYDKYNLYYIRCADEMCSFVRLDCSILYPEVDQDEEMLDEDETDSEV